MRMIVFTLFCAALAAPAAHAAEKAADIYKRMGFTVDQVLSGTVIQSKVVPGAAKQTVALATFYTGKKAKSEALNVRLSVFAERDGKLLAIYERDWGAERGGNIGPGDLQLVDLDRDGVNEIVVGYENVAHLPLIEEKLGEVILWDGGTFRAGWSGVLRYDATRAARDVPEERRDRYTCEIDFVETMRTRGVTLFVNKTFTAVAGQHLSEPKQVRETFALRQTPTEW